MDTPVVVQGSWERNGTRLRVNSDDQTSITDNFEAVTGYPNRYQLLLRFNPMTLGDSGLYQCSATVSPQNSEFVSEHPTPASRQQRVYVERMLLLTIQMQAFYLLLLSLHSIAITECHCFIKAALCWSMW